MGSRSRIGGRRRLRRRRRCRLRRCFGGGSGVGGSGLRCRIVGHRCCYGLVWHTRHIARRRFRRRRSRSRLGGRFGQRPGGIRRARRYVVGRYICCRYICRSIRRRRCSWRLSRCGLGDLRICGGCRVSRPRRRRTSRSWRRGCRRFSAAAQAFGTVLDIGCIGLKRIGDLGILIGARRCFRAIRDRGYIRLCSVVRCARARIG